MSTDQGQIPHPEKVRLKAGQQVFFVEKDEDKRELSYRKGAFLYAVSGGHKGRCMISTIYNGQELRLNIPRALIYTSEKDVRDEVFFEATLFGWRAAI